MRKTWGARGAERCEYPGDSFCWSLSNAMLYIASRSARRSPTPCYFLLLATLVANTACRSTWHTADLISFDAGHTVPAAPKDKQDDPDWVTWAPEWIENPHPEGGDEFVVFWSGGHFEETSLKNIYAATIDKDFNPDSMSEPSVLLDAGYTTIDGDMVRSEDGRYHLFFKVRSGEERKTRGVSGLRNAANIQLARSERRSNTIHKHFLLRSSLRSSQGRTRLKRLRHGQQSRQARLVGLSPRSVQPRQYLRPALSYPDRRAFSLHRPLSRRRRSALQDVLRLLHERQVRRLRILFARQRVDFCR